MKTNCSSCQYCKVKDNCNYYCSLSGQQIGNGNNTCNNNKPKDYALERAIEASYNKYV